MGAAAAFLAVGRLGIVQQDAAHDLGGDAEEVGTILPAGAALIDELQVGLVDEGSGLQGMAGALAAELGAGDPFELLVDERRQLIHHRSIAAGKLGQQLRNLLRTHWGLL